MIVAGGSSSRDRSIRDNLSECFAFPTTTKIDSTAESCAKFSTVTLVAATPWARFREQSFHIASRDCVNFKIH